MREPGAFVRACATFSILSSIVACIGRVRVRVLQRSCEEMMANEKNFLPFIVLLRSVSTLSFLS